MAYEGQKLGEGLMMMVMALFLHPAFSFVGFWLIGFGLLLSIAPVLGVSDQSMNDLPNWYIFLAMGIPVALAVLLRKHIPRLMKWIFFALLAVLVVAFIGGIISAIMEGSASS
ncbi:MAG: hypothetical protein RQ982_12300 [Gammaproteobacteria bacterium]|nr:hypothetical protein [Gammaproteobacteria bacterium]